MYRHTSDLSLPFFLPSLLVTVEEDANIDPRAPLTKSVKLKTVMARHVYVYKFTTCAKVRGKGEPGEKAGGAGSACFILVSTFQTTVGAEWTDADGRKGGGWTWLT